MIISTATGIILDLFVSRYSGFALLAVIISGKICVGRLLSVIVCSLSVYLFLQVFRALSVQLRSRGYRLLCILRLHQSITSKNKLLPLSPVFASLWPPYS